MSEELKIVLDMPKTTLNKYIRLERTRLKNNPKITMGWLAKKKETDLVYYQVLNKYKKITEPVHIEFNWYIKNRKHDVDNIAFMKKFIVDGFVKANLLENDTQRFFKGFTDRFYVSNKERVEVIIKKVEDN